MPAYMTMLICKSYAAIDCHIQKTIAENRKVIPGRDEWSAYIKELEGKGV